MNFQFFLKVEFYSTDIQEKALEFKKLYFYTAEFSQQAIVTNAKQKFLLYSCSGLP